jgi:hypothetical protein
VRLGRVLLQPHKVRNALQQPQQDEGCVAGFCLFVALKFDPDQRTLLGQCGVKALQLQNPCLRVLQQGGKRCHIATKMVSAIKRAAAKAWLKRCHVSVPVNQRCIMAMQVLSRRRSAYGLALTGKAFS